MSSFARILTLASNLDGSKLEKTNYLKEQRDGADGHRERDSEVVG